ncbi:MAG: hypothetical protein CMM28_02575 [Rhodospirillaceae bacterium]|nr:hypothetical protein [Rhodospirillaceae bacterium]
MIKNIAIVLFLRLLPTLLYLFWLWLARRHAAQRGNNAPGPDSFRDAPWLWLSIAGLALVIVSLLATPIVLRESGNPGTYIAPQYKDGKILPGHYDKK